MKLPIKAKNMDKFEIEKFKIIHDNSFEFYSEIKLTLFEEPHTLFLVAITLETYNYSTELLLF